MDLDNLSDQSTSVEPYSLGAPAKKARCLTSEVWKYFTKIGTIEGKERARCNVCNQVYVAGNCGGTSSLKRHLRKCLESVNAMIVDQSQIVTANKLDLHKVRDLIAYSIVKHNLPYSFVEYDGIRKLHTYLNPEYKSVTRKTAVVDVWNFYLHQKDNLKKKLARSPNRICLTCDCWTSITTEGYICLTAHFVDEKWTLNSKILSFSKLEPPHTGIELAKRVHEILVEWAIEKKVFSITLDNASANFQMQRILKENLNLSNSLICHGEFFHIRCCAHILNLIVQDGLRIAENALHKITNSIQYVRKSEARMIEFKRRVDQVGIKDVVSLQYDVPTRWNSTYKMLESALKFRRAFASLALNDPTYTHCPTSEEWYRAEAMCAFLKPFEVITNLISGSSYPTSNMYFAQISKIEQLLTSNLTNSDSVIREMAQSMRNKFDKYWCDYSLILALAVVLDPRMKLDILKFTFGITHPNDCQKKVEYVKSKLYLIFNEYNNEGSFSSSTQDVSSSSNVNKALITESVVAPNSDGVDDDVVFDDYFRYKSQDELATEKSELDYYLEEKTMDKRISARFNLLDHWKANSPRFPCLSRMACDILSIPITTVASESAFSIGSRVLTKYRSRLLPDNVEALICTRNWLLGFPWDEEDCETETTEIDLDFVFEASNIISAD